MINKTVYDDEYLFCLVCDHLQRKKEKEKVGVRESYFVSSIICLRLTDEKGYSRKSREREREVA